MSEVPAGWYPSPDTPGQLQYWDGDAWTDYRAVASDEPAAVEPAVAAPAEQAAAVQPIAVQPTAAQPVAAPQNAAAVAAAVAASQAGMTPAGSSTIVPAEAEASGGKKRFSLKRGGSATTAAATAAPTASEADAALKRARLISFAGGIGLFILGFIIGRIS